jgi:hypothetical protein
MFQRAQRERERSRSSKTQRCKPEEKVLEIEANVDTQLEAKPPLLFSSSSSYFIIFLYP